MEEQSVDEDALWGYLEPPLREACEHFVETRKREGENLKKDLEEKLDGLDREVILVQERSPEVVTAYREKLETKAKELLSDSQIDDSRIAAEVVLFSDKICNDEETVRLRSHIPVSYTHLDVYKRQEYGIFLKRKNTWLTAVYHPSAVLRDETKLP